MSITSEWVAAIAASISAIGVCFVIAQVYVAYKHMKYDHERSRREKATDMMQLWAVDLFTISPNISFARTIVESLDDAQCEKIWRGESIEVSGDLGFALKPFLSKKNSFKGEESSYKLNANESVRIRNEVTGALNLLECVASAWRHNVADRDILEEEFKDILIPLGRRTALSRFREASKSYPSLTAMENVIIDKSAPKAGKRRIA